MKQQKFEQVESIISVLSEDQKQLLKDTIIHGCWGDSSFDFLDDNGEEKCVVMMGYCTNDAKNGGHFSGRQISAMFRSMYKKLCPAERNTIGKYISHCRDWWGDGSGDMLFIRGDVYAEFEQWARHQDSPSPYYVAADTNSEYFEDFDKAYEYAHKEAIKSMETDPDNWEEIHLMDNLKWETIVIFNQNGIYNLENGTHQPW